MLNPRRCRIGFVCLSKIKNFVSLNFKFKLKLSSPPSGKWFIIVFEKLQNCINIVVVLLNLQKGTCNLFKRKKRFKNALVTFLKKRENCIINRFYNNINRTLYLFNLTRNRNQRRLKSFGKNRYYLKYKNKIKIKWLWLLLLLFFYLKFHSLIFLINKSK